MKEYEVKIIDKMFVVFDNYARIPFCVCFSVIDANKICNVLNKCDKNVYGGEYAKDFLEGAYAT